MKKLFAVFFVLFCSIRPGFTQVYAIDTINGKKIDLLAKQVETIQKSVNEVNTEIAVLKSDSVKNKECNCKPIYDLKKEVEGGGKWFIIFSPFYLLVLVVIIVAIRLKDFKFIDALTENGPPTRIIRNPEYNAVAIASIGNSIPNLSILFPPTIEISSNPTILDFQEIFKAKNEAVVLARQIIEKRQKELDASKLPAPPDQQKIEAAQQVLDAANLPTPPDQQKIADADAALSSARLVVPLDQQKINEAQTALDNANVETPPNQQKIEEAQTALDSAKQETPPDQHKIDAAQVELNNAKSVLDIALSDEAAAKINAEKESENEKLSYRPSISRYIAFITSMIIVVLVVCMSSFFIYHYMRTGCPPDFGPLTMMLIALGLGVTPYITNKISTAATTNKS